VAERSKKRVEESEAKRMSERECESWSTRLDSVVENGETRVASTDRIHSFESPLHSHLVLFRRDMLGSVPAFAEHLTRAVVMTNAMRGVSNEYDVYTCD
jgi:hypothetical protein